MDPEAERIRSYLQTQAEKLSLPDLVAKVETDMRQVYEAFSTFPEARWNDRPAAGEWSGNEVASHLVNTSKSGSVSIIRAIETGEKPAGIRDQIEHGAEAKTPADWWTALEQDRIALFQRLSTATGNEHLDVTWLHPMFGELNWREWLLFLRIHDLDHARQVQGIARALAG